MIQADNKKREEHKLRKQYSIKTFGCKVNTYDSSLIQKELKEKKWIEQSAQSSYSEVHIVNTCAVTEEAVKEAQRWVKRYRRKNPRSRIVVTGCAAQVETEKFSNLKEVDFIVANSHKSELADLLTENVSKTGRIFKSSIFKKSSLGAQGTLESGHTRLFLKIQDGCDSFCTFCIIPFARGKSRSIPPENLINSIQEHYQKGVSEVVLTGVHIGDYQIPDDSHKGLVELIRILLEKTEIPRIRLSSIEPIELSEELLDLCCSSPRICPHFHLSVQSAHSEVLQRMKRKYKAKDVENTLMDIHKKMPEAFVGMDIIAGFAGESQQQFEDTYALLKNCPWTKIHVFPYSPRRYTYAEKAYPSWPRSLVMKRASFLRRLSDDRLKQEQKKQIGKIKQVLPLKNSKGISRDYWTVKWLDSEKISHTGEESGSDIGNREVLVGIRAVEEKQGYLVGEPLNSLL